MKHLKSALAAAVAAASLLSAGIAQAAFPDKPIKLIVPYAPGGSADQMGRALAEGMSRDLKQAVVVENRPGASTIVGATAVARAPADGYTLLLASSASTVLNPLLYKKIAYDAKRDLKVISIAVEAPLVIVVNNQVPASNVRDFAAYAKQQAGRLNYSSVGLGNPLQLATELFKKQLGIEMTHLPYNGSAPALTALLSNDTQLMFDVVSTSLPHIKAGKLKAIAVTGGERLRLLPDVPTVAESGYPKFRAATWFGLAVPAGTPPAIAAKLQAAAGGAIADPQFRSNFTNLGFVVQRWRDLPEIARYMEEDRARWDGVIRTNNITLD
jgi:tripartite-type tricarboxylate transporter receptor subunit TctC